MARKPRIHLPGGIYHVMLCGNGGQDIFVSDADRCHFLLLFQEGIARFGHRIHAFCLMTNHVHLAIQVDTIPLSKIMQNLSFRDTRWFNRQEQRIGHLFQGRYRAVLVERDSYLLELVRYIHLNPLRAGMVQDVVDYAWSGHRAYALSHLPKPRVLAPDLDAIIGCVCEHYGMMESDLAAKGRMRKPAELRAVTGWLVTELNSATSSEVANRFGRDIATLSGAVRRVRERAQEESEYREGLNKLENKEL